MPVYSATIEIAAPREVVFEHIADLTRHALWSADPIEIVPAGANGYRATARAKGKTIEASIAVIERAAPERFVFDASDLTGGWRHTFTLTPTAEGTRVVREISGSLSPRQMVLYWIVLLPIKKPSAAGALRKLKQLIETGSA